MFNLLGTTNKQQMFNYETVIIERSFKNNNSIINGYNIEYKWNNSEYTKSISIISRNYKLSPFIFGSVNNKASVTHCKELISIEINDLDNILNTSKKLITKKQKKVNRTSEIFDENLKEQDWIDYIRELFIFKKQNKQMFNDSIVPIFINLFLIGVGKMTGDLDQAELINSYYNGESDNQNKNFYEKKFNTTIENMYLSCCQDNYCHDFTFNVYFQYFMIYIYSYIFYPNDEFFDNISKNIFDNTVKKKLNLKKAIQKCFNPQLEGYIKNRTFLNFNLYYNYNLFEKSIDDYKNIRNNIDKFYSKNQFQNNQNRRIMKGWGFCYYENFNLLIDNNLQIDLNNVKIVILDINNDSLNTGLNDTNIYVGFWIKVKKKIDKNKEDLQKFIKYTLDSRKDLDEKSQKMLLNIIVNIWICILFGHFDEEYLKKINEYLYYIKNDIKITPKTPIFLANVIYDDIYQTHDIGEIINDDNSYYKYIINSCINDLIDDELMLSEPIEQIVMDKDHPQYTLKLIQTIFTQLDPAGDTNKHNRFSPKIDEQFKKINLIKKMKQIYIHESSDEKAPLGDNYKLSNGLYNKCLKFVSKQKNISLISDLSIYENYIKGRGIGNNLDNTKFYTTIILSERDIQNLNLYNGRIELFSLSIYYLIYNLIKKSYNPLPLGFKQMVNNNKWIKKNKNYFDDNKKEEILEKLHKQLKSGINDALFQENNYDNYTLFEHLITFNTISNNELVKKFNKSKNNIDLYYRINKIVFSIYITIITKLNNVDSLNLINDALKFCKDKQLFKTNFKKISNNRYSSFRYSSFNQISNLLVKNIECDQYIITMNTSKGALIGGNNTQKGGTEIEENIKQFIEYTSIIDDIQDCLNNGILNNNVDIQEQIDIIFENLFKEYYENYDNDDYTIEQNILILKDKISNLINFSLDIGDFDYSDNTLKNLNLDFCMNRIIQECMLDSEQSELENIKNNIKEQYKLYFNSTYTEEKDIYEAAPVNTIYKSCNETNILDYTFIKLHLLFNLIKKFEMPTGWDLIRNEFKNKTYRDMFQENIAEISVQSYSIFAKSIIHRFYSNKVDVKEYMDYSELQDIKIQENIQSELDFFDGGNNHLTEDNINYDSILKILFEEYLFSSSHRIIKYIEDDNWTPDINYLYKIKDSLPLEYDNINIIVNELNNKDLITNYINTFNKLNKNHEYLNNYIINSVNYNLEKLIKKNKIYEIEKKQIVSKTNITPTSEDVLDITDVYEPEPEQSESYKDIPTSESNETGVSEPITENDTAIIGSESLPIEENNKLTTPKKEMIEKSKGKSGGKKSKRKNKINKKSKRKDKSKKINIKNFKIKSPKNIDINN